MKKILTITCHNVYNHGATLQQYALIENLKTWEYDVKSINYKPAYLSKRFKLWNIPEKYKSNVFLKVAYLGLKLPSRILDLKRKKNFDAFESQYLAVLPKLYETNKDLKNDLPDADVYICGSDQIWNSFFENGKDPAFYLNFAPDDKLKIAYAASFAIDELEEKVKPLVKKNVERLQAVSVRETSGLTILKDLGISNAVQVLDPVFLINEDVWKDKFVFPLDEKFIFVYDCDSNEQIKQIAQVAASENNFKIFTVDKNIKYADKNFFNEAPHFFLSLIYHSQFVLTNSFHALSFSIIFNKPHYVFNRTEKINTRMRDLMKLAGISELLLMKGEFRRINDVAIDFAKVNEKISNEVAKSKTFLRNALENKSNVT
ncbi:polysaccharide pyruvyl transferase family protein [Croceibacter atlanticus]|uniref:polysaccharide pyruvyl transferase family protein n=1 Tax=Croceibacter atlanticus TaxID=313588 RepID=UPI0030D9CBD7|tara:strand:- start:90999 stop:92117 length:1119 start_codon:yes stop_codon:yes gene_type:complete